MAVFFELVQAHISGSDVLLNPLLWRSKGKGGKLLLMGCHQQFVDFPHCHFTIVGINIFFFFIHI